MAMAAKDWSAGRDTAGPASRIPVFESIEEEAAFWDAHSFAEFADELEDVTGQVSFQIRGSRDSLMVRLDPAAISALNDRARKEQTDPATLVQRWVIERLRAS